MVPLAIRVLFEIEVDRSENITFSISDTLSEPVKFVSSQGNNKKMDTKNGIKKDFILNSN
tara:strand:+ start:954 stop:1133 length:180 start_codon:yes stop_codon:yes gene_type:complete